MFTFGTSAKCHDAFEMQGNARTRTELGLHDTHLLGYAGDVELSLYALLMQHDTGYLEGNARQ